MPVNKRASGASGMHGSRTIVEVTASLDLLGEEKPPA
jgi:hypothetical protein